MYNQNIKHLLYLIIVILATTCLLFGCANGNKDPETVDPVTGSFMYSYDQIREYLPDDFNPQVPQLNDIPFVNIHETRYGVFVSTHNVKGWSEKGNDTILTFNFNSFTQTDLYNKITLQEQIALPDNATRMTFSFDYSAYYITNENGFYWEPHSDLFFPNAFLLSYGSTINNPQQRLSTEKIISNNKEIRSKAFTNGKFSAKNHDVIPICFEYDDHKREMLCLYVVEDADIYRIACSHISILQGETWSLLFVPIYEIAYEKNGLILDEESFINFHSDIVMPYAQSISERFFLKLIPLRS